MGAAAAAYAVASARDRNGRESTHPLSAEARGPDAICAFPAGRERDAGLHFRRSGEDIAAAFRRVEENLRGDTAGGRGECAQSAARAALVQSSLRAEDDRDGTTAGR